MNTAHEHAMALWRSDKSPSPAAIEGAIIAYAEEVTAGLREDLRKARLNYQCDIETSDRENEGQMEILRKERDGLHGVLRYAEQTMRDMEADLTAARQRIEVLEGALSPFVSYFETLEIARAEYQGREFEAMPDTHRLLSAHSIEVACDITVRQFRVAQAALATEPTPEQPKRSAQRVDRRPSSGTNEAIERLLSLAGISCEPGWSWDEVTHKVDDARERMEELYGRTDAETPEQSTRFRSCAEWPTDAGLCCQNPTTDEHDTRAQAIAVCGRLHLEGFGGERKIFPRRTWVEPVAPEQPAAATDRELLDAMQVHKWAITPQCNGGWVIEGDTGGEDADVFEIVRTRGDIREAVRNAIASEAQS